MRPSILSWILFLLPVLGACTEENTYIVGSSDLTVVGPENQSVAIDLDANFGPPASPWLITVPPEVGTATLAGSILTVTPPADWVGVVKTVVAAGIGGTRHVIELIVEPVDDAPQIVGLAPSVNANSSFPAHVGFELLDVDTALADLSVSVSSDDLVNLPTNALSITGSGVHRELVISPPVSALATAVITVTVSATDGTSVGAASVDVTIGDPASTTMLVSSATWGGPTGNGALVGVEPSGPGAGTHHVVETFPGLPFSESNDDSGLSNSYGHFAAASPSGPFYGAATYGGPSGDGVLFRIDPVTLERTPLWQFGERPLAIDGAPISHPVGQMVVVGSKLFGYFQNGPGGIYSYDILADDLSVVIEFDTTDSGSHAGPLPFLGHGVSAGLQRTAGGRIFGTTESDGPISGRGTLFSFDPTRPDVDPNNPYDFKQHHAYKGGILSSPNSIAFEDQNAYGWAVNPGIQGLDFHDPSTDFAPSVVNGFFYLGFGNNSVTYSPDRNAAFVVYQSSTDTGGDGELVQAINVGDVRMKHTFRTENGNGEPYLVTAIGDYRLVGLSTKPTLRLWDTDTFAISPAVRGTFGDNEVDRVAGGLSGAGDYAFFWVHPGLVTGEASLVAYDADRLDVREIPVGYPRGLAPRGGLTPHPNGNLYGLVRDIKPAPKSLFVGFDSELGKSHVAACSWNPLSGEFHALRLDSPPATGGTQGPSTFAELRPVIHAPSGDLFALVVENHPSASGYRHTVYRIDPDTLAASTVVSVGAGAPAPEMRQGGVFVGDDFYFFADNGLYSVDVTAPTPAATLRDTLTFTALGRPTLVGGTTLFAVSPTGPSGRGSVYRYEIGVGGSTVHDFDAGGADGELPLTSLILAADGLLYGISQASGGGGGGVLFSVDPLTNAFTKVVDIVDTDGVGATPRGELIQLANGDLWGQAMQDGDASDDSAFSFRYTLTATTPALTTFPIAPTEGFGTAWPELVEVSVADQLQNP